MNATDKPWMITFCDLLSLLLTFFILMYALSAVDKKKVSSGDSFISAYKSLPSEQINYIYVNMVNKLSGKDVTIKKLEDKIMIILENSKFFKDNSFELNQEAKEVIAKIYESIFDLKSKINVFSHTTHEHHSTSMYGWKDALIKAFTIVKELQQDGYNSQKINCYSIDDSYFFATIANKEDLNIANLNSLELKIAIIIIPE